MTFTKARMNVDVQLLQAIGAGNYLDFGLPLTVQSLASGQWCPIATPDIQPLDPGATSLMLQLFIGQHFLNCALWTIYTNGILSHTIPSNTTQWAIWIPQIYAKWPNAGMEEQIYEYKLGTVNLAPGSGVTGDFPLALNLTVLAPARVHAATLGINTHVAFTMWVAPGKTSPAPYFYLKVASLTLQYSVLDSSVGNIDLGLLQGLTSLLTPILVQAIDEMLANGFPVPLSKGFTLSNPSVAFFPGYVAIEADFAYNPSVEGFLDDIENGDGYLMAKEEREHNFLGDWYKP